VSDREAVERVLPMGLEIVKDEKRLQKLRDEMIKWSKPNAVNDIVYQIFKLIERENVG